MFALLGLDPAVLIGLGLLLLGLVGAAVGLDTERGRAWLRRFVWFRRLELLAPSELRHQGLIAVGFGVCSFAALVTLKLFAPVSPGSALLLAGLAVVFITLGAAMLERAAALDGI